MQTGVPRGRGLRAGGSPSLTVAWAPSVPTPSADRGRPGLCSAGQALGTATQAGGPGPHFCLDKGPLPLAPLPHGRAHCRCGCHFSVRLTKSSPLPLTEEGSSRPPVSPAPALQAPPPRLSYKQTKGEVQGVRPRSGCWGPQVEVRWGLRRSAPSSPLPRRGAPAPSAGTQPGSPWPPCPSPPPNHTSVLLVFKK